MKRTLLVLLLSVVTFGAAIAKNYTHTVKKGETLESIATIYNLTVADIVAANPNCDKMFYSGLKLTIPEKSATAPMPAPRQEQPVQQPAAEQFSTTTQTTTVSNAYTATVSDDDNFEKDRKEATYELVYTAYKFDYAKESGRYGIALTFLPWELAPKFYAGFHFSPGNLNFGLSDYTIDEIRLGPAVGYYFTPKIFLSVPLYVACDVDMKDDDYELSWALAFAPTIYLGSKAGIFFGPLAGCSLEGGSDIQIGFRAGIYF